MAVELTTVLAAIALFLALGTAILVVLTLVPSTAAAARDLWPTMLTEYAILGTLAAAFWAGGVWLSSFLLLVAARVTYEAAEVALLRDTALSLGMRRRLAWASAGGAAILGLVAMALPLPTVAAVAVALAAILLFIRWGGAVAGRPGLDALLDVALFPGSAAVVMVAAGATAGLAGFLLLLVLLIETYDSYALLGGKLVGRRRIFPRLSPKKTLEGIVVGTVALAITAVAAGVLFFDASPAAAVGVAAATGVLAVAGDLAASRLKRRSGVKDYPTVLPRQGGLLDILDAWLLTGAVMVAALALMGLL